MAALGAVPGGLAAFIHYGLEVFISGRIGDIVGRTVLCCLGVSGHCRTCITLFPTCGVPVVSSVRVSRTTPDKNHGSWRKHRRGSSRPG